MSVTVTGFLATQIPVRLLETITSHRRSPLVVLFTRPPLARALPLETLPRDVIRKQFVIILIAARLAQVTATFIAKCVVIPLRNIFSLQGGARVA